MTRLLTLLGLAFALPATFAAATPVSRSQVLDAIRVFDANAGGTLLCPAGAGKDDALARASNTILQYSLESDDVVVDLGPDSVPWCDVKKGLAGAANQGDRGLLLAAYLSGCVKAQLASGRQDPNPYAGWVAMLKIYRAVKLREGVTIPEAESLLARQGEGSLETYAAAAVRRSRERLEKTYGAEAPPSPREIADAGARP